MLDIFLLFFFLFEVLKDKQQLLLLLLRTESSEFIFQKFFISVRAVLCTTLILPTFHPHRGVLLFRMGDKDKKTKRVKLVHEKIGDKEPSYLCKFPEKMC